MRHCWLLLLCSFSFLFPAQVSAVDFNNIHINGFISQGYLNSSGNNFLADSENGTFQINEVGLTVTSQINPKLRLGMQFLSERTPAAFMPRRSLRPAIALVFPLTLRPAVNSSWSEFRRFMRAFIRRFSRTVLSCSPLIRGRFPRLFTDHVYRRIPETGLAGIRSAP